jgi:hypothetical protein
VESVKRKIRTAMKQFVPSQDTQETIKSALPTATQQAYEMVRQHIQHKHVPELLAYLNEATTFDISPLEFWRSKETQSSFPALTKLARIYLSIPATSGDVERLFSVAGALQRARRARITTNHLEALLLVREYRSAKYD